MKFKVEFIKTLSYQMEIEANDKQEVSDKAIFEFDKIKNVDEEAQVGYWELVDIEEVK
jgi:hypothetical protein